MLEAGADSAMALPLDTLVTFSPFAWTSAVSTGPWTAGRRKHIPGKDTLRLVVFLETNRKRGGDHGQGRGVHGFRVHTEEDQCLIG